MEEAVPTVNVRLWHAYTIVLFDWLKCTDLDTVPITHLAQNQGPADLVSHFDRAADIDAIDCPTKEIAAAQ